MVPIGKGGVVGRLFLLVLAQLVLGVDFANHIQQDLVLDLQQIVLFHERQILLLHAGHLLRAGYVGREHGWRSLCSGIFEIESKRKLKPRTQ